jgi:hypothetical protein
LAKSGTPPPGGELNHENSLTAYKDLELGKDGNSDHPQKKKKH